MPSHHALHRRRPGWRPVNRLLLAWQSDGDRLGSGMSIGCFVYYGAP